MKSLVIIVLLLNSSICTTVGTSLKEAVSTQSLPIIIAHRGSSGTLPEHTAASYQLAIDQGADIIECDVTITMDLVLVCIHQNWLKEITDVEEKFPEKETDRFIEDSFAWVRNDFFAIDLTLEELKTLRMNQRFSYRDQSFNGQYEILTLDEYIDIAQAASRTIGIYPETKDPDWTNSEPVVRDANTTFERLLVENLERRGYSQSDDPCFIQSFHKQSLLDMSTMTQLPLIKLAPLPISDNDLDELAEFCTGIGPSKGLIIQVGAFSNKITGITDLVSRAHSRGLLVHPFTLMNENRHLAYDYGQDPYEEYKLFIEQGVDGIFTDFPLTMDRYLEWEECEEV